MSIDTNAVSLFSSIYRFFFWYFDSMRKFSFIKSLNEPESLIQSIAESLINRYVIYPTILLKMGGNQQTVHDIVFAEDGTEQMTLLRS